MIHRILRNKKKIIIAFLLCVFLIGGCGQKVEPVIAEAVNTDQEDAGKSNESDLTVEIEIVQAEPEAEEEEPPAPERPKVRGIFVTGAMAGTENMDHLIDLVDQTELNAMVIDIKNDEGRITYEMENAAGGRTWSL